MEQISQLSSMFPTLRPLELLSFLRSLQIVQSLVSHENGYTIVIVGHRSTSQMLRQQLMGELGIVFRPHLVGKMRHLLRSGQHKIMYIDELRNGTRLNFVCEVPSINLIIVASLFLHLLSSVAALL